MCMALYYEQSFPQSSHHQYPKARFTRFCRDHSSYSNSRSSPHPSVRAVLDGVKWRAGSENSTIFIHTSGTSALDDNSLGAFKSNKDYYDTDPDAIKALSDYTMHRQVDLEIVRGQQKLEDNVKLAIVILPKMYGLNTEHMRLTIEFRTITMFLLNPNLVGHVKGAGLRITSPCPWFRSRVYHPPTPHIKLTAGWTAPESIVFLRYGKECS